MKKYLLILLALLPMMLFTACSSDKEEETSNNLVGTTWQYLEKEGNKITSMTVLEFKSNTVVKIILLSGKNKLKTLYLFTHRCCSRFTYPEAWFSVSNCKHYKMCLY